MVKTPVLIVVIVSCLANIEAFLSQSIHEPVNKALTEVKNKCTPGKFYKRGCKVCFCDESKRPVCGADSDCKKNAKPPSNPDSIRKYSRTELLKLPTLTHQAAVCVPGTSYRVDCNACLCLANKNLMCNDLLCPSYDDVNRIKAKSLTGKPCTTENENQDCVKCACVDSALKCEATPKCVPNEGRRGFRAESPLDLDYKDLMENGKQCTPGMVYKRDCNRCYCQEDSSLRCTLMRCLKHTEVKRLQKLRLQLEKEGL